MDNYAGLSNGLFEEGHLEVRSGRYVYISAEYLSV